MESIPEKTAAEWIEDLAHTDWAVRRSAAESLGRCGSPEAVEPLLKLLEDEDWKTVRAAAVEALGHLRDPRGVDPILEALQDEEFHLRQAAVRACRAYGTPQLAPRLLQLLRAEYLQFLRNDVSSYHDFLDRVEDIQAVVVEALVSLGSGVVPWVVEALQDHNRRVQQAAIQVLGEVGGRSVIERLNRLARRWSFRERSEVQEAARQAISRIQARIQAQGASEPSEWSKGKA